MECHLKVNSYYSICFSAFDRGVDVQSMFEKIPYVGDTLKSNKMAQEATAFAFAYAVHKAFMPVRLTITFTTVPIIVRYLRAKGILKGLKK